jgi:hypothetical protein
MVCGPAWMSSAIYPDGVPLESANNACVRASRPEADPFGVAGGPAPLIQLRRHWVIWWGLITARINVISDLRKGHKSGGHILTQGSIADRPEALMVYHRLWTVRPENGTKHKLFMG